MFIFDYALFLFDFPILCIIELREINNEEDGIWVWDPRVSAFCVTRCVAVDKSCCISQLPLLRLKGQSVDQQPRVTLLEMQTLKTHPRTMESEPAFQKISRLGVWVSRSVKRLNV